MNKELDKLESVIKKEYGNIAGIIINKNGSNIYEKYLNSCNPESSLHIYSVTKSVISILFGIVIDKGFKIDLDQKVLDFFPDYKVTSRNKTIEGITLKHLLTMTSPYKYSFFPPYIKYFTSDDWVNFSLTLLGGKGSIGKFNYAPLIGPDILSGILYRVTGKTVLELANEYLFAPLEINKIEKVVFNSKEEQIAFNKSTNIRGWASDSIGTNPAGWGLTLSTRDMVKIGKLILNKGVYRSRKIVSEKWINIMTTAYSKWNKHNILYGLLWWIIDENKGVYAAMGDGGNIIYINRSKDLVVSISSLFTYRAKDRIKFIQKYIEDKF